MKFCFLPLVALLFLLPARAADMDSLKVSLLTVEPRAEQVYTIYGHTALRILDPARQIDLVFNWGTFDFNAPHFLLRFVRGETDYFLSTSTFDQFMFSYQLAGASVIEQTLFLSPEGKKHLLEALSLNMLPENRIYRYNFLFDNCTTRVRDLIEQNAPEIAYPAAAVPLTFRQLIHSCTAHYQWMTFGIDLLIGSGADTIIQPRQQLFLPLNLSQTLDNTLTNGLPLVQNSQQILINSHKSATKRPWWDAPQVFAIIIFLAYVLTGVLGRKKPQLLRFGFAALFLVAGLAGCLLLYMALFSEHPCVSRNWNLVWLNPLQIVGFFWFLKPQKEGKIFGAYIRYAYHIIGGLVLAGFLLFWRWIPQQLNPANVPIILTLLLAAAHSIFVRPSELLNQ